eukprot:gene12021-16091_t
MGGGSSVLPVDKASQLSNDKLQNFYDYEKDCFSKEIPLSNVELHILLTTKYEELITEQNLEKEKELKKKEDTKSLESKSKIDKNHATKKLSVNTLSNEDEKRLLAAKEKAWNLRNSTAKEKLMGMVTENAKLKKTMLSSASVDVSLFPHYDDVQHIEEDLKTYHELHHSADNDSWVQPNESVTPTSNSEVCECKLCKQVFPTKKLLDSHISFSKVHENNVANQHKKFEEAFAEAEKIAIIVRKAVQNLQDNIDEHNTIPSSESLSPSSGKENNMNEKNTISKLRWKKSISKVTNHYVTEQMKQILDTIEIKDHLIHDIHLLYQGTKFFWKQSTTFQFRIYVHTLTDCVEIISQMLPQLTAEGNRAYAIDHTAIQTPRIYLSYSKVKKQAAIIASTAVGRLDMMNLMDKIAVEGDNPSNNKDKNNVEIQNGLSDLLHITNREVKFDYEDENVTPTKNPFEHLAVERKKHHETPKFLSHENFEAKHKEARLNHLTSANQSYLAEIGFIMTHLRLDYDPNEEAKEDIEHHNRLYFDCTKLTEPIPLLEKPPSELIPVPLDMKKVVQNWEIRMKLDTLRKDQSQLITAVKQAEIIYQKHVEGVDDNPSLEQVVPVKVETPVKVRANRPTSAPHEETKFKSLRRASVAVDKKKNVKAFHL